MYRISSLLLLKLLFGLSVYITQAQELPQPSTFSSSTAVIGLTEIKVSYSAPAVRGRKIWGGLVPYNALWRSGANAATTFTFSDPVMINGQSVPSGIYSFYSIPGENSWTLILNKNHSLNGTKGYDSTLDVVRITTKPMIYKEFKERLDYDIEALSDEEGEVSLVWENLKVSFRIQTDAEAKMLASIKAKMDELSGAWYSFARSAEYFYDNNLDLAEASKWADMSIQLQEHFYNRWVKAKILAKQGLWEDSLMLAQEAKVLGERGETSFYEARKKDIQNFIAEAKQKMTVRKDKK